MERAWGDFFVEEEACLDPVDWTDRACRRSGPAASFCARCNQVFYTELGKLAALTAS
jgi:hypothetical protein